MNSANKQLKCAERLPCLCLFIWWHMRSWWCNSCIDVPSVRRREQLLEVLGKPEVPLQNLLTLHYLLRHLEKVCQYAEHNGLDIHTLGQIFGPLLIRGPVSGWACCFVSLISIGWRQILEMYCWKFAHVQTISISMCLIYRSEEDEGFPADAVERLLLERIWEQEPTPPGESLAIFAIEYNSNSFYSQLLGGSTRALWWGQHTRVVCVFKPFDTKYDYPMLGTPYWKYKSSYILYYIYIALNNWLLYCDLK